MTARLSVGLVTSGHFHREAVTACQDLSLTGVTRRTGAVDVPVVIGEEVPR